ncbi:hypothetical protein QQF64_025722 [Cirrhinus molitorella]|uniref:Uncharacterized protein n=1 Tax=Cirrhinus molitorella TaxID=172907 RepID=A0ABR3NQ50_9TELE
MEDGIRKIVPQNAQLQLDENGRIIMAAMASDGTPAATTASDGTPAATARLMYAEREIQDFRLRGCPKTLYDCVRLQKATG